MSVSDSPIVPGEQLGDKDWRPEPGEVAGRTRRILAEAVRRQASDVHFNSHADGVHARCRVNGILHETDHLPHELGRRVVHHLKALAGMNIIERRRPQDGRMLLEIESTKVDFRLATIFGLWGENLAIRIFDRSGPCRRLDDLGLEPDELQILRDLIHAPQGLLLVTGPTGAGKTATLYAALEEIKRSEINLVTVEDPVEHEIAGVNQIGVQPKIGVGFLECLRSAFRQDPDVLMIGEIRDGESARIAIRAALSGHLVLSTLHTGTAAGAIAALIHLGIEPFLIATSLIGVVAQQLVRTICPSCRTEVPLEVRPEQLDGPYREEFTKLLIEGGSLGFSYGAGCEECMNSGYRARTGIFEILRVSSAIRHLIIHKAPAESIEDTALVDGMVSMKALGMRLVIAGRTTIEEILRVVPVGSEELVAATATG